MGWPQVTFIALYVFMATANTAVNFHKKGANIGCVRIVIEVIMATVTFWLLIQGGFFV